MSAAEPSAVEQAAATSRSASAGAVLERQIRRAVLPRRARALEGAQSSAIRGNQLARSKGRVGSRLAPSTCDAFHGALRGLQRPATGSSVAVCMTGQLRLFMISLPGMIENVLAALSAEARVDFFYVGPADVSFAHGRRWLQQLPGLQACSLYSPTLRWASRPDAPLYEEVPGSNHSARRGRLQTSSVAPKAAEAGFILPSEMLLPLQATALPSLRFGLRASGCTEQNARSRVVQAWQARRCLSLIERHEAAQSALRGAPWQYDAVLRMRADALPTRRLEVPLQASLLARPAFTPFDGCPRHATGRLADHDFALLGRRDVMGFALRAIDEVGRQQRGVDNRTRRHACEFDRLAGAAVWRALPQARCVRLPGGGSPVGSPRGNVRGRCFFVDVESPPNDGQPQPQLRALGLSAASGVATQCLGLEELRDRRRPGSGAGCTPRGGWDGDFRTDASPWDASAPNRGAG